MAFDPTSTVNMRLYRILGQVMTDRRGAATIEYALILAFIVLAMFAALQGFAGEAVSMWNSINTKSSAAIAGK